ncbi:MAG TPA: class I SAM-dependent methyltransferase [Steroidobacteraceae bacterium]|nr:class I SAM-dependent methyltransferase [Steroidobacteraceae bacterium]
MRRHELERTNRDFYESLWGDAQLINPERFNTWPLVESVVRADSRCLEVAPGLRPRLPLAGTRFVDMSERAVARLREAGASAEIGTIDRLPFANEAFDLVCAMDIIEHIADDAGALRELTRVLAPRGTLLLSVPLHESHWTAFDDFVGHCRRYEPAALTVLLAQCGLRIERSAVYGMQPRSSHLLDLGLWYLVNQRERAMWWYNRVFMPLAVRLQKPLKWVEGLIADEDVDEVLILCRPAHAA